MYQFKLTEEIARWSFEVICKQNPDWYIAFTNPTAGPWKTVKSKNINGVEGEVYRFNLEETRPDIVIINDKLQIIIIIEAKDTIDKLTLQSQPQKSIEVVDNLNKIFKSIRSNDFWGNRTEYKIITGLLWGTDTTIDSLTREKTFDVYHDIMKNFSNIDDSVIIGIETQKSKNNSLICHICGKIYNTTISKNFIDIIAQSFNIPKI